MSEHKVCVTWHREGRDFSPESLDRTHEWVFEGGVRVPGSSAPGYGGDPALVDPEEAFVAALSSCHMLFVLALAARRGFVIESYEDDAIGVLQKGPDGKQWMTDVTLRPRIVFAEGKEPSAADMDKLHHRAHELCFIANSVKTDVAVEPR
ncbi:MAG: OsmC family peroxiredoxin [Alphaproteobacteria bacterium]|nr:OsmC family peroxiredoxin [Alphaproteobacteria bacterium]